MSSIADRDPRTLTAIEKSHLEGLKSLKNIADAKSEVLRSGELFGQGIAVSFSTFWIRRHVSLLQLAVLAVMSAWVTPTRMLRSR